MPEYLKLDSRKLTFGEYWNMTRSPTVIIPWVAKVLRMPMKFSSGFQRVEAVRELEVPENSFSAGAREKLQPLSEQCLAAGFHSPQYFCFKSLGGETETSFIALLHGSGECSLRLMHTVATTGTTAKVNLLVVILSELNDGTYLATSNQRAKFINTPGVLVHRLLKATPAQLLELHQQKMAELFVRNRPRTIASLAEQDAVWDRYEKMSNDFGVQRGIYVPLKPEEQEAAIKKQAAIKAYQAEGVENADVLAELNNLQEKKRGWGNAIFIFIVSMLAFVGAGSRQWSWEYALMLVPILFIHELGHYVAMRSFNYRNLRMFFIPFFGAAVSGRHYNVPGWKKVVVSLMGPVPGILLGALLGGAGLMLHQALMIKLALVTLILNGFNLLPVLPLDGGWVFHTLIFSRHYLLDAAFRVLAVIGLMLIGIFSHSKILIYVGIPMLLGIPMAYRMARVVTTLRQRGVPPASTDDQTIPVETAQIIIAEVKQALPKAQTSKLVAEQTMQIFETLNARPPGWLATGGLLAVHFVSVGLAVVFAMLLIVGQRGDLGGFLAAATRVPKHKLACDSLSIWRGEQAPAINAAAQNTLVATFPNRAAAQKTFQKITNEVPTDAVLKIVGESLLLMLPAGRDADRTQWLTELQAQTKDVFVDNTNFQAGFSLAFLAPTTATAKALEGELQEYLHTLPGQSLAPPWLPHDARSPAQRAQDRLARQTYLKLESYDDDSYDTTAFSALQKKMSAARRQGDKAGMDAIQKEMRELSEASRKQHFAKIRAGDKGPVDTHLVDLFLAQQAVSEVETNVEELMKPNQEMARQLGQVPLLNGQAAPDEARYLARYGGVTRKDLLITLTWVNFDHLGEGVPALVEWLCAQGCTDLRYNFQAGTSLGDE